MQDTLCQEMVVFKKSFSKYLKNDDNIDSDEFNKSCIIYFNLISELVKFDKKEVQGSEVNWRKTCLKKEGN